MKNNIKKYISVFTLLILGLIVSSCLEEETDFGSDVSKVVPQIFDLDGPTIVFVEETGTYSVTNRGGSEFIWTVTNAEAQPIDGRTDMINVYYNQFSEPVSVSVYEVVANGRESEVSTIDVTVFGTPCDWTIDMYDSWGDGWNGASLSIQFDGIDSGNFTMATGSFLSETIAVPDGSIIDVDFSSGEYDNEISFGIYDASGTLVYGVNNPSAGNVFSGVNTCP